MKLFLLRWWLRENGLDYLAAVVCPAMSLVSTAVQVIRDLHR